MRRRTSLRAARRCPPGRRSAPRCCAPRTAARCRRRRHQRAGASHQQQRLDAQAAISSRDRAGEDGQHTRSGHLGRSTVALAERRAEMVMVGRSTAFDFAAIRRSGAEHMHAIRRGGGATRFAWRRSAPADCTVCTTDRSLRFSPQQPTDATGCASRVRRRRCAALVVSEAPCRGW